MVHGNDRFPGSANDTFSQSVAGMTSSKSPKSSYRHDIDGLRALAVIAVIAHHLGGQAFPFGYLGVDIFFVISGYVVTLSILRKLSHGPKNLLIDFYYHRIRRILPLLLTCVAVTIAASFFVVPNFGESIRTGLSSLVGMSNIFLYRNQTRYGALDSDMNLFTQTWSLGVEEQFYIVAPLIFFLVSLAIKPKVSRIRIVAATLGILALISAIAFAVLYKHNPNASFYLITSRFWELAVGCVLALYTVIKFEGQADGSTIGLVENANRRYLYYSFLVIALSVLLIPAGGNSGGLNALRNVAVVIGTAGLIHSFDRNSIAGKLFTADIPVYIGKISFSLYLWHWAIITLFRWSFGVTTANIPIILALTFIFSAISYRFVEIPFRFKKSSLEKLHVIGIGAGATAVVFVVVGLCGKYNHAISDTLYIGDKRFVIGGELNDQKVDLPQCSVEALKSRIRCQESATQYAQLSDANSGHPENGHPKILVIGDSHAEQLKYPVSRVVPATDTIIGLRYSPFNPDDEKKLKTMDAIVGSGDIVIAATSPIHMSAAAGSPSLKLELVARLRHSLAQVARIVEDRNGYLLLVKPPPNICSKYEYAAEGIFPGTCRTDRNSAWNWGKEISRAYDDLAGRSSRVIALDAFADFCPPSALSCGAEDESGHLLYADYASHITRYGQEKIEGRLGSVLRPLLD